MAPDPGTGTDGAGDAAGVDTSGGGAASLVRLVVALCAGIVLGIAVSLATRWQVGILSGWMATALVFITWVWVIIWPMDAAATAAHAGREDPGRSAMDTGFVIAAVASLGAVAVLLYGGASSPTGHLAQAALSFGSVSLSWATVHTLFTTRYARLYYSGVPGGVDFNEQDPPQYSDFAYLSFTLGMTFQVSDTDLQTKQIRATALRQSLLSYLFGVVIIATMINLIAGLGR